MKLLEDALQDINFKHLLNNYDENKIVKYIETELKKLKSEKEKANFLLDVLILAKGFYYEEGFWLQEKYGINSLISDNFYDKLEDLYKLYSKSDIEIGLKTEIKNGIFPKYKHTRIPGVSQNKTHKKNDIETFTKAKKIENETFIVSEKLDGSSLYLIYDNKGKLIKGVTRGDGYEGNDITINIHDIKGIKKEIDVSLYPVDIKYIEIRGEAVLSKKDLIKINEHSDRTYKNTRNAIPGILMSPYNNNSKYLTFMAYEEIMEFNNGDIKENDGIIKFENLKKLGFKLPYYQKIDNIEQVYDIYKEYIATKRKNLPYDIDGLVITVNDNNKKNELGYTNKKSNGSFAFKFPAPTEKSIVKDIHFQLGDASGNITPVVEIEPVDIEGATITKISLANYALFTNTALAINDTVFIRRSGDVIPQIVKNEKFDIVYNKVYNLLNKLIKLNINKKINQKIEDTFLDMYYLDSTPLRFEIMTKINKIINPETNKNKILINNNTFYTKEIINEIIIPEIKKIINKEKISKLEKEDLLIKYSKNLELLIENNKIDFDINKLYFNLIKFTTNCPVCGSELSNNGTICKCVDNNCSGRKIGQILTFVDKAGIKGLKKSTITFLYENNIIDNINDLFKIQKTDFYNNNIIKYKGWGERKIDILLSNIEKLKTMSPEIFLGSLAIENFSVSNFTKLLEKFKFEDIINNNISIEEYQKVEGFDKTIPSLIKAIDDKKELITNLLTNIKIIEKPKPTINKDSIKMYFTGAVKGLELKNLVNENNIEFINSTPDGKYHIQSIEYNNFYTNEKNIIGFIYEQENGSLEEISTFYSLKVEDNEKNQKINHYESEDKGFINLKFDNLNDFIDYYNNNNKILINKKEELYKYINILNNNIVPTSKFSKSGCDILVYNGNATTKIDKAKKMNIKVFTLDNLLNNIDKLDINSNINIKNIDINRNDR